MWKSVKPSHVGMGLIALGFIAIILGWNGAANVNCIDCQLPYLLSGGFAGLAFIVVGGGLLLFEATRRQQAHLEAKLQELIDAVREKPSAPGDDLDLKPASVGRTAGRGDNGMVVVGRSSFHRPGCRLVEGKDDLAYATAQDAKDRGLTPCRVCEPTQVSAARR